MLEEVLCPNTCNIAQLFGGNSVSVYADGGLLGHPGIDIHCGYGTDIFAPFDMNVYSVIGTDSPLLGPQGYTQVGALVETPLETFEWLIGHCDPSCQPGLVKKGEKIATEANHGPVWDGNTPITLEMQRSGDKRGAHRHYQKRPLIKVTSTNIFGVYLNAYGYYKDSQGFFYKVYNPGNGYNGCVDWSQPLFTKNLGLFSTGYEVLLLQRALVLEGYATFAPTGYFGLLTRAAVQKYQTAKGLEPVGYTGPLTRQALNQTYPQLPR